MRKIAIFTLSCLLFSFTGFSQNLNKEVFYLLNLNGDGLEKVKALHDKGKDAEAAQALLEYYQSRTSILHPSVDLNNINIGTVEQQWADDALQHKFFAHRGYQPSYSYGDDINWEYWPIQDNELRWQLHRHKWWSPMGKAYKLSGDEKYAKEWAFQYLDWIDKNPLLDRKEAKLLIDSDKVLENMGFAWRPLEVSHRLEDQTEQFLYFKDSPHFTPAFLSQFLVNYHKHAEHILQNYSERGNHLLFEAQRVIYAGAFFPEFKDAEKWRRSGVEVLSQEIKNQVFDDGMQYELDPHYHLASINIFNRALQMADINGFRNEFPDYYLATIEKMIEIVYNLSFPDYTMPCFGDAKAVDKKQMLKNYNQWQQVFPNYDALKYFATDRQEGTLPAYHSKAFKDGGYYVLRNGWDEAATVMIFKAGPPAFWHNQPDNGTFELFIKGRNFFPDAGSYVYGGGEEVLKERNWFRQTMVHKTLTLNNENIEETNSKLLLWETSNKDAQKVVVQNQSYKDLAHRRTVFFVDESFFVIVDEAMGSALGKVGIHYQLAEGTANFDKKNLAVATNYEDDNNVVVKTWGNKPLNLIEEEGWVSYDYRQKSERPAFVFEMDKNNETPSRFITVIYPFAKNQPAISAQFDSETINDNKVEVSITVGMKRHSLIASW